MAPGNKCLFSLRGYTVMLLKRRIPLLVLGRIASEYVIYISLAHVIGEVTYKSQAENGLYCTRVRNEALRLAWKTVCRRHVLDAAVL